MWQIYTLLSKTIGPSSPIAIVNPNIVNVSIPVVLSTKCYMFQETTLSFLLMLYELMLSCCYAMMCTPEKNGELARYYTIFPTQIFPLSLHNTMRHMVSMTNKHWRMSVVKYFGNVCYQTENINHPNLYDLCHLN